MTVTAEDGTRLPTSLTAACDTAANTSRGLVPGFYRITDACGLAEQFLSDGSVPGEFVFTVGTDGVVLSITEASG